MSDALERAGFSLDWSNPLASTLDEVVRGIIKQFNLDDLLEQVSGDNERLLEIARKWRRSARDMRGVAEDLVAERRTLQKSWVGDASTAFGTMMNEFEKAVVGEADDMDTVAELLEMAAESCAMAEESMVALIVEIVEAALAWAATTAILAVLTAGAAAAIAPLIAAAGIANRALKAVRITAQLADKLSDLAKRMRALRKLAKLRGNITRLRRNAEQYKKVKKNATRVAGKVMGVKLVGAAIDAAPVANSVTQHYTGVDVGAKASEWGSETESRLHETTGLNEVRLGEHRWDVDDQAATKPHPPSAEEAEYSARPNPKSYDERFAESAQPGEKSVREAFG